ncbi:MAG: sodium:alanine symporter family protein [Christensenellales bacterium]
MAVVDTVGAALWSPVGLMLLIVTGLFFSFRLKFLPQRKLFFGIRSAFSRGGGNGDISSFSALMTSLGAAIGTGNIAGVAAAYAFGGPGAIFWMWVTAVTGIATGYAEGITAVKYRVRSADGQMRGGPMYALERGLVNKKLGRFLAVMFSVFTIAAAFCTGSMVQANAASDAAKAAFGINPVISGLIITAVCSAVMLGGIKSVAAFCCRLVPFMGLFYIAGGIIVIALNAQRLAYGVTAIFTSAFTGHAAIGGFAGASVMAAMRFGGARGVFSNETGIGSTSIASSAAKIDDPVKQGLVQMTVPFFDTLVVCTITALTIACTEVWQEGTAGVPMAIAAFEAGLPGAGRYIVSTGTILFAFTSVLGWSFYGERAVEYLAGSTRLTFVYRAVYCCFIFVGAVIPLKLVWGIADIAIVMMALPNLFCLICLSGDVVSESRRFWRKTQRKKKSRYLIN